MACRASALFDQSVPGATPFPLALDEATRHEIGDDGVPLAIGESGGGDDVRLGVPASGGSQEVQDGVCGNRRVASAWFGGLQVVTLVPRFGIDDRIANRCCRSRRHAQVEGGLCRFLRAMTYARCACGGRASGVFTQPTSDFLLVALPIEVR